MLIILIVATWLALGSIGFAFWWTKEYDLTTNELPIFFLSSFIGPFAWFVGASMHDDSRNSVICKKRGGV